MVILCCGISLNHALSPFRLQEVSVLFEPNFGHLRYRLTDLPPQQRSPSERSSVRGSIKFNFLLLIIFAKLCFFSIFFCALQGTFPILRSVNEYEFCLQSGFSADEKKIHPEALKEVLKTPRNLILIFFSGMR